MHEIRIDQLDKTGQPFRTFRHWKTDDELRDFLDRKSRAYLPSATRVTVDGREVALVR